MGKPDKYFVNNSELAQTGQKGSKKVRRIRRVRLMAEDTDTYESPNDDLGSTGGSSRNQDHLPGHPAPQTQ